jgi:hypothetical protein
MASEASWLEAFNKTPRPNSRGFLWQEVSRENS